LAHRDRRVFALFTLYSRRKEYFGRQFVSLTPSTYSGSAREGEETHRAAVVLDNEDKSDDEAFLLELEQEFSGLYDNTQHSMGLYRVLPQLP
jgi:hypothetical protein